MNRHHRHNTIDPMSLAIHDPVWHRILQDAEEIVAREPALGSFIFEAVLNHARLEDVLIDRIANRLGHVSFSAGLIRQTFAEALDDEPTFGEIFRVDIVAVHDRDPACTRFIEPLLYFKGFHGLQAQRLAHWLWNRGRRDFALMLQSLISEVLQIDIHPAVSIGRGIFVDHGTGIVIGSTATIEDAIP